MIVKIITLFLVAMAVLAMFGLLRLRWLDPRRNARCGACGRPRIGKGPCGCGGGKRG
ncbi:MAG: hypothetical protein R3D84_10660 [Paracoccaceae bacterium]